MRITRNMAAAVATVAALALAGASQAATLNVTTFSAGAATPGAVAQALGQTGPPITETFDGFALGEHTGPLTTAVGTFSTLGGVGGGGSVVGAGAGLGVRDGFVFGRHDIDGGAGRFLDSNDTFGIRWQASGSAFSALSFLVTDAGDVGGSLSISVDGVLLGALGPKRGDGVVDLVQIMFAQPTDGAVVDLRMDRLNDGFAVDSASLSPAVVPLPAAGALLLAGLAALWLACRRVA